MLELFILVYATAVGFVAAGLVSSLMQCVTSRPLRFSLAGGGSLAILRATLLFAVTGPMLVLRTAAEMDRPRRSPAVAGAALGIALLWSACSGIVLVNLLLVVHPAFS